METLFFKATLVAEAQLGEENNNQTNQNSIGVQQKKRNKINVINMKTYSVEVMETISRVVDIDAESHDDALEIVKDRYLNGEIVLDDNDFPDFKISLI